MKILLWLVLGILVLLGGCGTSEGSVVTAPTPPATVAPVTPPPVVSPVTMTVSLVAGASFGTGSEVISNPIQLTISVP